MWFGGKKKGWGFSIICAICLEIDFTCSVDHFVWHLAHTIHRWKENITGNIVGYIRVAICFRILFKKSNMQRKSISKCSQSENERGRKKNATIRIGFTMKRKKKSACNEQCNCISGINNIKPNERILLSACFFFRIEWEKSGLLECAMAVCNPASLGLIAYTHRTQFCTRIKNIILYAHTIILPSCIFPVSKILYDE